MSNNLKLPNFFCPLEETELSRVGKENDGGYLIPKKSINQTKILYSFGLSDDWSFESEFYNKSNAKVICYDLSVNWKFWVRKLFRDLKNIFFLKIKNLNQIYNIFSYLSYKTFFDGINKIHVKKYIMPIGTLISGIKKDDVTDLKSLLNKSSSKNIFFKIDIEGNEYKILDQLIEYQSCMTGLTIEFHDCDLHQDKIKNFIENFDLQLVHLHVNNWGSVNQNRFPSTLELTFSPKEFNTMTDKKKKFPTSLDYPNNPLFPDLPIEFGN